MAKELSARIVLYGSVDSSVGAIGKALDELGSASTRVGENFEVMGRPLRKMGKDMIEDTFTYEQGLNKIKAITKLTGKDMRKIDESLKQVALTSRFTPLEIANSYGTLMMAGVKWQDGLAMQTGLVRYATAANMELNEATSKLISNLYATGTPLEQTSRYTDILSTVATNSKTDVIGLSDAVIRMGAVSRYFKSNEELITWLGMMGNLGYESSEAGTYLRNVMLAIAAPTTKAADTIEALGIAEESLTTAEIDELQAALDELGANDGLSNTRQRIQELGLDIYNTEGKMRSMVDIFKDMQIILSTMTEEQKNRTLGNIFPKRTLSAATGMLSILEKYDELYEKVANDSEGAAKRQADAMDSGMVGVKYRLESAKQQLKLSFGDLLENDFIYVSEKLTGIMKDIIAMPTKQKASLLGTLKAIAFTGPSLMIAGKGLGLIGKTLRMLTTPTGTLIVGGSAIATIASAISNMNEEARRIDLAKRFGNLEIDIDNYASAIDKSFRKMIPGADIFDNLNEQMTSELGEIEKNINEFGNSLYETMLGDGELSETDKASMRQYADNIYTHLVEEIKLRGKRDNAVIDNLFTGAEAEHYKLLNDDIVNEWLDKAESIKSRLESTLKISLEDGIITGDEAKAIAASIEKYTHITSEVTKAIKINELMANMRLSHGSFDDIRSATLDGIDKIVTESKTAAYVLAEDLISRGLVDEGNKMIKEANEKAEVDRGYIFNRTLPVWDVILEESYKEFSTSDISGVNKAGRENFKKDMGGLIADGFINQDILIDSIAREFRQTGSISKSSKAWLNRFIHYGELQNGRYNRHISSFLNEDLFNQYTEGRISYEDVLQKIGQAKTYGLQYASGIGFFEGINELIGMGMSKQMLESATEAWKSNPEGIYPILDNTALRDNLIQTANDIGWSCGAELGLSFNSSALDNLPKSITWDLELNPNVTSPMPSLAIGRGGGTNRSQIKNRLYAEGGRADEASIFGEAGPEWAIPEAHTQNTLNLLSAAARASGFGADDIARNMEKNITFAPVINVTGSESTDGIEKALEQAFEKFEQLLSRRERDKERLSY